MGYKNLDLTADARKAYTDIATNVKVLGEERDSAKAQQKLALLNHQVIFNGLKKVNGLNDTLDEKVNMISKEIDRSLKEKESVSLAKIFSLHIGFFMILFFVTIYANPANFNIGYLIASIGMGCATSILQLMLIREKGKYTFSKIFGLLAEEDEELYYKLHQNLAKIIDESNASNEDENITEEKLKTAISEVIK